LNPKPKSIKRPLSPATLTCHISFWRMKDTQLTAGTSILNIDPVDILKNRAGFAIHHHALWNILILGLSHR
jgi:hypothetical protein